MGTMNPFGNQFAYRWRTDTGAVEGTPTWEAAENNNPASNWYTQNPIRLRVGVENTGTANYSGTTFALYVSKGGGSYTAVTSSSSNVRSYDYATPADNDAISTHRLTTTPTAATPTNGAYDDAGDGVSTNISTDNYIEFEFAITIVDGDVANSDTLDFRVYVDGAALDNYDFTPRLTVNKPAIATNQLAYRFRSDTNAPNGTPTWEAAENTNPTNWPPDTGIRIRFLVDNTGGTLAGFIPNFRVSVNSGAYGDIITTNQVASWTTPSGTDGDTIATADFVLATSPTASTAQDGYYDESGTISSYNLVGDRYTEHEVSVIFPSTQVSDGDTIDFRIYRNTTAFTSYSVTPRIVITVAGSETPQSVNISADASLSLTKAVTKDAFAISSTATNAVIKAVTKTAFAISSTATNAVTTMYSVGRNVLISATSSLSQGAKTVGKLVNISSTGTLALSMVKSFLRTVSIAAQGTLDLTKAVGIALAFSATGSLLLAAATIYGLAVSISATASLTMDRLYSVGREIAIAVNASLSDLTKDVGKLIGISATGTLVLSLIKTLSQAVSISANASLSVLKSMAKGVAISLTGGLTVSGVVSYLRSVAISSSASAGALVKGVGKAVALSASSTLSLSRSVGKLILSSATAALSVIANFIPGGGTNFPQAVNISVDATASFVKSVGKVIQSGVNSVLSVGAVFIGAVGSLTFAIGSITISALAQAVSYLRSASEGAADIEPKAPGSPSIDEEP